MPKPSVLTFLHSFEPGGVERVALRLCGAWDVAGLDSRLLIGREEGVLRADHRLARFDTAPHPGFSTARFETFWMMGWLARALRLRRPDILFCAGNSYTVVACVMKLLLGPACPLIVAKVSNCLIRSDLPLLVRPFYRVWCRIQGRLIDRFVALSPAMRTEVMTEMGVPPSRVAVIANPVLSEAEIEALARAGSAARNSRGAGRRFLAAGRLVPQKDFAMMIEAFAAGAAPDDTLVIIGEGPERDRLERLIDQLGLGVRVSLPGHQCRPEDWFARGDILLLSSRYEGLPGVVVEALAAGLPVIATDCCASMTELLGNSAFGTIVPAGQGHAFATAIRAARVDAIDRPAARALAACHAVEEVASDYAGLFTLIARSDAKHDRRPGRGRVNATRGRERIEHG